MEAPSISPPTDVLHRVCDLLPPEQAAFIRTLDPSAYYTYVQTYVAVRRSKVELDRDLQRQLVRVMFDFHDAQAAEAIA